MALGSFSNAGLGFGVAYTLYDYFSHTSNKIQRSMTALDAGTTRLAQNIERNMARARIGVGFLLTSFLGLAAYVKGARIDAQFQQMQIGLETFVGSAARAERVMQQIRKDAIDNPVFKYQKMFEANMMMISQGVDPNQSQRVIKNLTTILLAAGRGNEELARMGINLQQLAAGAFTMRDVREFGYAGVNLRAIFKEFMGIDLDKFKGTNLTIDLIDKAFQKATASGTKYGQMLSRVMETVQGRLMMVEEQLTFTFEALGQSIREQVTLPLLEGLSRVLVKMQEFLKSPIGQWVARMTFYVIALTGALALLSLVVLGAKIGLQGLGLTLLTNNAAIKANTAVMLASKSVYSGWWGVAERIVMGVGTGKAGLSAAFTTLSSRITASSLAITGFFRRVRLAIPALVRTLGPFMLIGSALLLINKAITAFNRFTEDTNMAPGSGFTGWLQKTGAMLKWVTTLFTSYEKTQKGMFTVPTEMTDAFRRLGILDNMLKIATWVARLIELWRGFKQGVKEGMKLFWEALKSVLRPLIDIDNILVAATSGLSEWRKGGVALGMILSKVFIGLLAYMGLMIVAQALMATAAIVNALAMMAAYWPVYLLFILLAGAVTALWAWSDDTATGHSRNMDKMVDSTEGFFSKVSGIDMTGYGEPLGNQLANGIYLGLEQYDLKGRLKQWVREGITWLIKGIGEWLWTGIKETFTGIVDLFANIINWITKIVGFWNWGDGSPWIIGSNMPPGKGFAPKGYGVNPPAFATPAPAPQSSGGGGGQRPVNQVHVYIDSKEVSAFVTENYQWMMGSSHSGE